MKLKYPRCRKVKGEKSHERYKRLVSEGYCGYCGCVEKREGKSTCEDCAKRVSGYRKKAVKKYVEQGLCHRCGGEQDIEIFVTKKGVKEGTIKAVEQVCSKCYYYKAARMYLPSSRDWEALKEKFEKQNRRCVYTGIELDIGRNAHIDHIKPVNELGTRKTTIDNLQFIHYEVNYMKGALPEERFLELVNLINIYKTL